MIILRFLLYPFNYTLSYTVSQNTYPTFFGVGNKQGRQDNIKSRKVNRKYIALKLKLGLVKSF